METTRYGFWFRVQGVGFEFGSSSSSLDRFCLGYSGSGSAEEGCQDRRITLWNHVSGSP